jgi:hypothetical protein
MMPLPLAFHDRRRGRGLLAALLLAATPAISQTPVYDVEDVTPHLPFRINASGEIAGARFVPQFATVPAVFRGGVWHDLPPLMGDPQGVLVGINAAGEAVGWSSEPSTSFNHPCGRYRAVEGTTALAETSGLPANAFNRAINDDGVIVGCRYDPPAPGSGCYPFYDRAYVHRPGLGPEYLFDPTPEPLQGGDSCAHDANAETAVGYRFRVDQNFQQRAFRYDIASGTLAFLETPTAFMDVAWAINEHGAIAGSGRHLAAPFGGSQAFVWTTAGGIVDLGVASTGAFESAGRGINEAGDVVGSMTFPGAVLRAFLARGGSAYDLNHLVPVVSGRVLQTGLDIDDAGRILVSGQLNPGTPSAQPMNLILTPRSAQQGSAGLIQAIQQLQAAGDLNGGNANALIVKVEGAIAKIASGDLAAATQKLEAFVNQVEAFVRAGKLTSAQAEPLLAAARWLIAELAS